MNKDNNVNIYEIEQKMFTEIGHYHCYVNYFYPESHFGNQINKIEKMIKHYCDNKEKNHNIEWDQEQLDLFKDEIENMC